MDDDNRYRLLNAPAIGDLMAFSTSVATIAATTASAIMGTPTTDFFSTYEDAAPTTIGAELPPCDLDTFVNAELLDAADELAALLELRRRLERFRRDINGKAAEKLRKPPGHPPPNARSRSSPGPMQVNPPPSGAPQRQFVFIRDGRLQEAPNTESTRAWSNSN